MASWEASMNEQPGGWLRNGKNLALVMVSLIALVEFFLLVGRPAPSVPEATSRPETPVATAPSAPGEAVRVAGLALDPERGRYLLVAFDRPAAEAREGQSPAADPATIAPAVPGKWTWLSPFMLRFEAKDGFAPATEYTVTLKPDVFLAKPQVFSGQDAYPVSFGSFEVTRLTAHLEPAAEGGAMVVAKGQVVFNRPVDPKALADHIRLIDPNQADGKPVAVSLTTTYATKKLEFVSDPVTKTAAQREVKVEITPGVLPEKGDVPLSKAAVAVIPVVLDPNLRVREVKAASEEGATAIRIGLSTPVEAGDETAAHVHVAPELACSLAADGAELVLSCPFEPGRDYAVTLDKGLVAADGAVLPAPFTRSVRIPDLPPSVDFKDQGIFLSRNGYKNLAVKSVNTNAAHLIIDRIYCNNLFPLFSMEYSDFEDEFGGGELNSSLGDRIVNDRIPLPYKNNAVVTTPVNLGNYIQGHAPGLYRVALTVPGKFEGFQRYVLITDIGIVAKHGLDDFLVWTASYSTLSPIAGAKVRILSYQNQELASGVTDDKGLFRAKVNPQLMADKRPYLIMVEKGADTSFLLYERFRVDTTGLDVGGAVLPISGYTAFLYGERDIYRPGETLEGLAVVRDAKLAVPPSMPVTIRLTDPQGRKIAEQTAVTGAEGMVSLRQPLPAQSLTGSYTLELATGETAIGQYRFQVEEFVPDRISVAVEGGAEPPEPGEALPFGVTGRYLFGAPAADLPVEARARLVKAAFAPKGYDDYVFGDPERSFEDQEIMQENASLDSEGKASFAVSLPEDLSPPAALEAIFTARVREGGGRGVTGLARLPVHVYPAYPGLKRLKSQAATPGKPMSFDFVMVAPDGKLAPTEALTATLFRDTWQTVLRKGPDGSFKYESTRDAKTLETKSLAAPKGKGSVSFTPPSFGSYRLVLSDEGSGASCQLEFYAGGFGYSPWAVENPARLELKADKKEYASGETAKFQVRAPFGGKLLVTVEGSDVRDVLVLNLPGNTGDISLPVKPEYMPGVYVTATLVRKASDVEPGSPSRAYGAVPLLVDRASGRLPVTVTAPAEMRPGGKLAAEVAAPPGSVITLAAVDEGILQLVAQKTPDPFAYFYAKRQLQVETFDTFSMLLPEVPPVMGKALAGGGDGLEDLSGFVRSQSPAVRTVAFWSGPVTVGPTGKAQVAFDIPEFQGQVRLMAAGIAGRQFASAEARTLVKSPLVLLPSFPRFLSFDDAAKTSVTVRNDTGKDGAFTVGLTATGPAKVDSPEQRVSIAKGGMATAVFPVTAGQTEGLLDCAVSVAGGGEASKDTVQIPVRSPLPPRTSVQSGAMETATLTVPELASAEFLPGTARRDITVGRFPLIRFTGNLKSLLGYPYGCIEQTVSRAFPLLYFADLAKALDPGAFETVAPSAMVQAGIRRITGMQIYDGGFSMWPGGSESQPWMSLYAAQFLVEAKLAGYSVDPQVLSQALTFAGETGRNANLDKSDGLKLAAYALYVQAKAGRSDIGAMDNLRDTRAKDLPPDARGLLGAAYAAVGNTRSAEALASGPAPGGESRKETGGTLDSSLRDKALFLSALIDAAPADPRLGSLASDVARLLEGEPYPSTQENAFALLALGKFFARQKANKPFSGLLYAGSGLLSDFSSDKVLSLRGVGQSGDLRLDIDHGFTPGACYYSVRTRGIPVLSAHTPQSAGLEVSRQFLTRDGQPIAGDAVPQGSLVVVKFAVRATTGPVANVVLENLLPAGLEVENPRLSTTEKLPWMETDDKADPAAVDLRDDRVLLFVDLPDTRWHAYYALLRAVTPGVFSLPPAQAEAMYAPELRGSGPMGRFTVTAGGN
jgi:uncharacterized protein YfaS (alpha-2-macroglobulin family)